MQNYTLVEIGGRYVIARKSETIIVGEPVPFIYYREVASTTSWDDAHYMVGKMNEATQGERK